jgi:hypothetical protein
MSPKKIQSIEVVNELYVIGNTSYGGLINILSKNRDMGGIDLPVHSYFFKYRGYQDISGMVPGSGGRTGKPGNAYLDPGKTGNNDPDHGRPGAQFRNCLYWEPDLYIEPDQTINLSFTGTDQPGLYRVLVRGVAEDGSHLYGTCDFRVEP